ncbi:MAG: FG-GAP repeat protein [Bacteroidetes bacterium]|nr:FG-GAP repeat protein [Bacteroidota bacterium]
MPVRPIFFRTSGSTWAQQQKIVADRLAPATNDYFGYSVAISGDYAIVGAYQEDEDAAGGATALDAGSAYIF